MVQEDGGGEDGVRFEETLMVNLTPKQTNLPLKQMALLCNVAPSPLTIHTIP